MTMPHKPPQSDDAHAAKRWPKLGHADDPVRHTDAWEQENFEEEQARWERSDPEYARICGAVRQARDHGEEASQRADQAKADWDARVAPQRRATDDAEKAHHALTAGHAAARQTARSPFG